MKKLKWMALIAVGILCNACDFVSPERCVKGEIIAYWFPGDCFLVSLTQNYQHIAVSGTAKFANGSKKYRNVVMVINPEKVDTTVEENFKNKNFHIYAGKKIEVKLKIATDLERDMEGAGGYLLGDNDPFRDIILKVDKVVIITEICSKMK